MKTSDLVIKNARVLRPNARGMDWLDLGTRDGAMEGSCNRLPRHYQ